MIIGGITTFFLGKTSDFNVLLGLLLVLAICAGRILACHFVFSQKIDVRRAAIEGLRFPRGWTRA